MINIKQINIELISESVLNKMYAILIHAYAETEKDLWGLNYVRVSKIEFIELIKRGEVFGAFLENEIVGSIHVYKNEGRFSFGLLSADFNKKNLGIGRSLITYIEKKAKKQGAKYMNLELLRPINNDSPFKNRLKKWYTNLGYIYSHSGTFSELKSENAKKELKLIQPCLFDCYQKTL